MKLVPAEAELVDLMLQSDGYRVVRAMLEDAEKRARDALARETTDWAKTNYLRGRIAAYEEMRPEAITRQVRHALGGPDGNT